MVEYFNIKVKTLRGLIPIIARERRKGKRIVTTNGCFDILHVGHVTNLACAKRLGDVLIVGVNSDRSVRENKGPGRPIVPARERAGIIGALQSVDYVFIFDEAMPVSWLEKLKPDIHVKGADRKYEEIIERNVVEKNGGRIVRLPLLKGHSTTDLIARIKKLRKN